MRANELVTQSPPSHYPPTLIEVLRAGTAREHALIEDSLSILRDDFSRGDYEKLLMGFYRFHASFEPVLHGTLHPWAARLQLPKRRKIHLLQADLHALGVHDLRACESAPAYPSAPAAIGALYVIEGSTLGGAVISRHLKKKLPELSNALGYFSSYGEETGKMWRDFLGVAAQLVTEESFAEAVSSAVDTFRRLRRELT